MGFRNPITSLSASQIAPGVLPPGVILPPGQLDAGNLPLGVIAHALANGTVTPAAIAPYAVAAPAIATNAVIARHILAGEITAAKIAAGAVTADKIDARAITAEKIDLGVLATNRVSNPGFEEVGVGLVVPGSYVLPRPGWSIWSPVGDSAADVEVQSATHPAARGRACLLVTSTSTGGPGVAVKSDLIPVRAYIQYRISGSVAAHTYSGGATAELSVWWRDATGALLSYAVVASAVALPNVYTELAATMTAPPGTSFVTVLLRNNGAGSGGRYYHRWDDIAVIEIGTPAVETTAAGIRMWDSAGVETISLHGNGGTIIGKTIVGGSIRGAVVDADSYLQIGSAQLYGYGTGVNCTGGFYATGNSAFGLTSITMPSTTAPANVNSSGDGGVLARVSSLRRFKLNREPIGVHPELLDLVPVTWRDAAEVEADPDTDHRTPGFVAEDVLEVSAAHGGSLEPLLTRDEDGALQGLAYDRIVAYLLPIVAEVRARVLELEEATR